MLEEPLHLVPWHPAVPRPQLLSAFSSCASTHLKPLCLRVVQAPWSEGCSGERLSLSQLDWWAEMRGISYLLGVETLSY